MKTGLWLSDWIPTLSFTVREAWGAGRLGGGKAELCEGPVGVEQREKKALHLGGLGGFRVRWVHSLRETQCPPPQSWSSGEMGKRLRGG